jgi:hypothetical protein
MIITMIGEKSAEREKEKKNLSGVITRCVTRDDNDVFTILQLKQK